MSPTATGSDRASAIACRCPGPRSASFAPPWTDTARLTGLVAVGVCGGVIASACAARLTSAGQARTWLHYSFPGVPHRAGEATAIFAHNGRALLGVFGMLLVAQATLWAGPAPGRVARAVRVTGEALLAGLVAANTLVVGVSLGAYGPRMARAVLPHAPVELAAFALALALYLQGRQRRLPLPHVISAAAVSVILLAAAAILETFVEA